MTAQRKASDEEDLVKFRSLQEMSTILGDIADNFVEGKGSGKGLGNFNGIDIVDLPTRQCIFDTLAALQSDMQVPYPRTTRTCGRSCVRWISS